MKKCSGNFENRQLEVVLNRAALLELEQDSAGHAAECKIIAFHITQGDYSETFDQMDAPVHWKQSLRRVAICLPETIA
jgi:hypothetical protein